MDRNIVWHRVEQINEDTWRIVEAKGINCFLLTGTERALLIDTGNGLGNLGEVVSSLTDLPVTVALTHRHCDHTGGIGWFSGPAHVHEADFSLSARLFSMPIAARWLSSEWAKAEDFPKQPYDADYTAIADGTVFGLGGRTVTAKHIPGHTRGSAVFLDDRHKMLFAGDNIILKGLWMWLPGALSVEEWLGAARQIHRLSEKYTVYPGHGDQSITSEEIAEMIEVGSELVRSVKRNRLLPGRKSWPKDAEKYRIDYNPANVLAKKRRVKAEKKVKVRE